jgi:Rieske Fe-S protein
MTMNARSFRFNKGLNKDSTLISALIGATLIAIASGAVSNGAFASDTALDPAAETIRMEPIVVTAKRGADVKLDTVVVTASRITPRA